MLQEKQESDEIIWSYFTDEEELSNIDGIYSEERILLALMHDITTNLDKSQREHIRYLEPCTKDKPHVFGPETIEDISNLKWNQEIQSQLSQARDFLHLTHTFRGICFRDVDPVLLEQYAVAFVKCKRNSILFYTKDRDGDLVKARALVIPPHPIYEMKHSCAPTAKLEIQSTILSNSTDADTDRSSYIDNPSNLLTHLKIMPLVKSSTSSSLTFSLVPPRNSLEDRRREIEAHYGFMCKCSICQSSGLSPDPPKYPTQYPHLVEQFTSHCWWCGSSRGVLLLCSRCKRIRYCSVECQKDDWKSTHKSTCEDIQRYSFALNN